MVIVWKQYPRQEFENETAKFEAAFLKHAQKLWMHTYVLHFSNADTLHVYFEAIWSIPYDQKYRNIYISIIDHDVFLSIEFVLYFTVCISSLV